MGYYMSELYRRYFRAPDFSELKEEIEHTRQEVRDWLDQTPLRRCALPAGGGAPSVSPSQVEHRDTT